MTQVEENPKLLTQAEPVLKKQENKTKICKSSA